MAFLARTGPRLALLSLILVLADAGGAAQVRAGSGSWRLFAGSEVLRPPGSVPRAARPARAPTPQDRPGAGGSAAAAPSPGGKNARAAPKSAPAFPPVTPLE
jgi:hypothetical protein